VGTTDTSDTSDTSDTNLIGHALDALHAKRSQAIARDTHIKSAYVTIFKAQIELPEIRVQKVQHPIVFLAVALRHESNPTKK
jgi:hypothetical protein